MQQSLDRGNDTELRTAINPSVKSLTRCSTCTGDCLVTQSHSLSIYTNQPRGDDICCIYD